MSSPPVDVLITLPFTPDLVSLLQEVSPRLRVTVHRARRPEEVPEDLWARCDVLYTTPSVLPTPEQAPRLRWIQFHYAGIDKALSAPILRKPDVLVTTLSGAAVPQMGEYVLTMLLALGHRLPAMMESKRKSEWPADRWERFSPRELRDSTVGIVGYGSVGREVARLLRAFGATVLATKRDAMHPADTGYTPEGLGDPQGECVRRLYPRTALRSMARECDFLVVAVPLTPETRGLVNAEVFAAMKPGAFLVDISRGGVVDQEALIEALQSGRLGGAALDVFPEEPLPSDNPLWSLPNVIISPHIAGDSPHYDARAARLFAENLRRYLAGQPLYNLFDPERGY
ncbi:MAG: D-2-hydroxyacid dehydrogenase [Anaerolineae bacterium]|nr:MAG: D-2-hydroxyacid dehydrogenase [Anaerolineae bacterium]